MSSSDTRPARKRVLIVCTGNSARSQMAEGFLRHEAGDQFEVFSAGTEPGTLRPEAVQVMREIAVDISSQWSKPLDRFLGQRFDYVITVCDKAREQCPAFPGETLHLHWPFNDPASADGSSDQRLAVFRKLRDKIHSRVMVFLGEGHYAPGAFCPGNP
ncbi:MAG: arsenate reductase ArsC [Acidobacteriia bacterium]|nr:arsenate reductase ArsC [Terriglobia bacterium]